MATIAVNGGGARSQRFGAARPMPTVASRQLDARLAHRKWIMRTEPFPHFVGTNVFRPQVYLSLVAHFRLVLSASNSYLTKHDIHGATLTKDLSGALGLFAEREWHDLIASLLGIKATGHINIGLHHHEPNSSNGFAHNDVNPGWFADYPSKNGIWLPQPELCSYTTGETVAGVVERETVRAAAILFYLDNPPWSPGAGGETGLYANQSDNINEPVVAVPPTNNTILVFECTPYSFHGFISNRRNPRNSLVMWLHREKVEVIRMWGADAIVPYV